MGYLGSKAASGVFQAIIALMPPHETFIDLFVGSGAILKRKPEAVRTYAVDLDSSVVDAIPDAPRLTKVKSSARSFLDSFDYDGSGRVLIYADPPYLHSTRTSRHRYKHEMTDADHLDLLAQLRAVPASVILSGYPSDLYEANLPGWNSREFQAMTRGGVRTEKVWFNFEPVQVYSAKYVGKDYIDRQRIKRKAQRWAANYAACPPGERLAILSAILAADADGDDDVPGLTAIPDDDRGRLQLPLAVHDRMGSTPGRKRASSINKTDYAADPCQICGHGREMHSVDWSGENGCDWRGSIHERHGEFCGCEGYSPMPDYGAKKLSPSGARSVGGAADV